MAYLTGLVFAHSTAVADFFFQPKLFDYLEQHVAGTLMGMYIHRALDKIKFMIVANFPRVFDEADDDEYHI